MKIEIHLQKGTPQELCHKVAQEIGKQYPQEIVSVQPISETLEVEVTHNRPIDLLEVPISATILDHLSRILPAEYFTEDE